MRKIFFWGLIITICFSSYGQDFRFGKIKMDGFVSYQEMTDTTHFKIVKRTSQVLIKESEKSFYIGISSNDFLVINIYIKHKNGFKILHASGSLGTANYIKKGINWVALNENYHWAFVDPTLRKVSLNQEQVDNELKHFYKNNLWVGTTFAMGSIRESEFVISKTLIPSIDKVIISYYYKDAKGKRFNKFYPTNIHQFTDDLLLDKKLMNGYLPILKRVHFDN